MSARVRTLLVAVFLLGAGVRAVDLWRPVDGRVREGWRECDVAGIARNFYREGMNIWYPRIDWRGTGPGYAEMEFPVYPWLIAASYKVLGYHEIIGRFIAYAFSLATVAIVLALARLVLPTVGVAAAGVFFALSPLIIRVANAIQPEALMLCAYVAAVYAFLRWLDTRKTGWYVAAVVATALTILAKVTAAHIGLLFAILLVQRRGWKALAEPAVLAFAVLALLPGAIWYLHAHAFWVTYGNSLGVSNEDHWIGPDVLRQPAYPLGLIASELYFVWMPPGLLLAIYGLATAPRSPAARLAVPWYAAILIFYVATIRTTSAVWALYYHVFSAVPAALLVGLGVAELARVPWRRADWRVIGAATVAGIAAVVWMVARHVRIEFGGQHAFKAAAMLLVVAFTAGLILDRRRGLALPRHAYALIAAVAVPVTALLLTRQDIADAHPRPEYLTWEAAEQFKPMIPPGALILSSGGYCSSNVAPRLATNYSVMFYWLDRKGFNVCVQQQSVTQVTSIARRGAQFFVAKDAWVADSSVDTSARGGDGRPLRLQYAAHFPLLAQSHGWSLYDLRQQ
jgi:4-amino-4-deoxy-L-arabinose transferase-like glycosyltransferase